ncbi:MAG: VIT1/CCC1 transporter family protein [Candidatus Aenigmatarchaeota archaeon]
MDHPWKQKHAELHKKGFESWISSFILGCQDGLVNVLGILLGVAAATGDVRIIIIAGLAATFAESISMAAVAYTSSKAEAAYYQKELAREKWEIRNWPDREKQEVRVIYRRKGFTGPLLEAIVRKITSKKSRWLRTMMEEEVKLSPPRASPLAEGAVVGASAIVGSLVPLVPFFFLPVAGGIETTLIISAAALFAIGAYKAKITVGRWWSNGLEMATIGMAAAVIGYLIGSALGVVV